MQSVERTTETQFTTDRSQRPGDRETPYLPEDLEPLDWNRTDLTFEKFPTLQNLTLDVRNNLAYWRNCLVGFKDGELYNAWNPPIYQFHLPFALPAILDIRQRGTYRHYRPVDYSVPHVGHRSSENLRGAPDAYIIPRTRQSGSQQGDLPTGDSASGTEVPEDLSSFWMPEEAASTH